MGAKGKKNLSQQEFDNIKLLLQANPKPRQIKEVTGRSISLIAYTDRSNSLEDYNGMQYIISTLGILDARQEKIESKIDDLLAFSFKFDEELEARLSNEKVNGWRFGKK